VRNIQVTVAVLTFVLRPTIFDPDSLMN